MYQIAGALKHMLDKRIMHRDIKPANIFLAADGVLKLGDLGLGRYLSSQTLEAFSKVGTPLYMSPEVLQSNGYDWKSDVWSLGCVIYELAMLTSPFKGPADVKMSLYDLFNKINKGEFLPISEKYSNDLNQIVQGMIMVEPYKRLSVENVISICEQRAKLRPRIDAMLVMDDVNDKLQLLNYETLFCKLFDRKPIPKVCFAIHLENYPQFEVFYEICYWIMSNDKSSWKKRNMGNL